MNRRLSIGFVPRRVLLVLLAVLAVVVSLALVTPDALVGRGHAQVNCSDPVLVSGDLPDGTQWVTGSCYRINDYATVPAGATLTIQPGVEVQSDHWALDVLGTLVAVGTAEQPILFTSTLGDDGVRAPGDWVGVLLTGTVESPNTSWLEHVTVEYAETNLYLEQANPLLRHVTLRRASGYGLYGFHGAAARMDGVESSNNGDWAFYFHQAGNGPTFANLGATGNPPYKVNPAGKNAVAFGNGTLHGEHTWPAAGLPYVSLGDILVPEDGSLFLNAGVQVQFDNGRELNTQGKLVAAGTPDQPVLLTGVTAQPGWWAGLDFVGGTGSRLDHAIVEYGGLGGGSDGNIYIQAAPVTISNSVIRHGLGDGVMVFAGGEMVSIRSSQILDNLGYGVGNHMYDGPGHDVDASNNWWGDPSGPALEGACGNSGTGSTVSEGVIYKPFATSGTVQTKSVQGSSALTLTLEPNRWYVPADGVLASTITATLRDGGGGPVQGRTILYTGEPASVVVGGATNVNGQTSITVKSDTVGDVAVSATTEKSPAQACEQVRVSPVTITFTAVPGIQDLTPNDSSPYVSGDIEITPKLTLQGQPSTIKIRLTNPTAEPVYVNGVLGVAQSGIGVAFGPIKTWENYPLGGGATAVLEAVFVPQFVGHFCYEFSYSWRPQSAGLMQIGAAGFWDSVFHLNDTVNEWFFGDKKKEETLKKTNNSGSKRKRFEAPPPEPFLPLGVAATDPNAAIAIRMPLAGEIARSLLERQPRVDYKTVAQPQRPVATVYAPGEFGLSPAQSASANALLAALDDAIVYGRAAVLSANRADGAAADGDAVWSSQQVAAVLHYNKQYGLAMLYAADALDSWLLAYPGDQSQTAAEIAAEQAAVGASGLSAGEVAALRALLCDDAEIERIRQAFLTLDPAEAAVPLRQYYATIAASFRETGDAFANPPDTFSAPAGGAGFRAAATGETLARGFDVEETIKVGNPLAVPAEIMLSVRRLGLPADWNVSLTPSQLSLMPGQARDVVVRISPASPAPQGTTPSLAVEGYVNGELLGGVQFRVFVPRDVPFDLGHKVYLPLAIR